MATYQSKAGREMAIATAATVMASICGALLAEAFGGGSPPGRLIGAVVGAVVTSLFTVAGPYLHLRAAAGIMVTVVALVITYSGAILTDTVTKSPTTIFPRLATQSG